MRPARIPPILVPDDWLADRATFEDRLSASKNYAEAGGEIAAALLFGRLWLRLLKGDESVAPHLLRDGYWESWVSLAFARAVRPGARVVDAGAHLGWFTYLALARGAGRVFAIEPQPELSALLRAGLWENDLARWVDHWCGALGREWRTADLLRYGNLSGSASLEAGAAEGWTPTDRLSVGVAPLDGILEQATWNVVDLVKVDVEGAEAEVWEGMQRTLARNPQAVVLMEVGEGRGYSLPDFVARMLVDGFRIRVVAETGELVPREAEEGVLFDVEAARMVGAAAAPDLLTLLVDRP